MRHYALKHCQPRTLFTSLLEKRKETRDKCCKRVKYVLKASIKASVVKIICYICAGISIPYIIGMAYCQLIHYSKSPKQREQRSRRLMLFLSVYTCVSCQRDNFILRQAWKMYLLVFCLRRLAMPE